MTKKQIFLTTVKNNKDGVSINPLTMLPVNTNKGYFVSITDNKRIKADYRIVSMLKNKAKELGLKKWFIGYWKDGKTGFNYFDLSLHINDKKEAIGIAKIFNQKAIYGINEGVIYCQ